MSDAPADVTLPYGLAAMLAPIAAQFGISLPGMGRVAPTIDAAQPMRALADDHAAGRLEDADRPVVRGMGGCYERQLQGILTHSGQVR